MKEEVILYEKKDNVAWITLNRPDKRNALNSELVKALRKAWVDFESDPEMRVAVLTANGNVFCAGMDLGDLEVEPIVGSCIQNVGVEVTKPVVGAINGPAVGVGLSLATNCDLKVMSEKASFIFPEAKTGCQKGL
jgi:enoyl-CoA hydratase/carnithine racemase